MYFPKVLQWFDDIGSLMSADFLLCWPDLDSVERDFGSGVGDAEVPLVRLRPKRAAKIAAQGSDEPKGTSERWTNQR
jgi:hypothetical protein